ERLVAEMVRAMALGVGGDNGLGDLGQRFLQANVCGHGKLLGSRGLARACQVLEVSKGENHGGRTEGEVDHLSGVTARRPPDDRRSRANNGGAERSWPTSRTPSPWIGLWRTRPIVEPSKSGVNSPQVIFGRPAGKIQQIGHCRHWQPRARNAGASNLPGALRDVPNLQAGKAWPEGECWFSSVGSSKRFPAPKSRRCHCVRLGEPAGELVGLRFADWRCLPTQ